MHGCVYCGKQCKNKNSLVQHQIRCPDNPDRIAPSSWVPDEEHKASVSRSLRERYLRDYKPKSCATCSCDIPYDRRANKTCSKLCHSKLRSTNNRSRDPSIYRKQSDTLRSTMSSRKTHLTKRELRDEMYRQIRELDKSLFTKVSYLKCSHCEKTWYHKSIRKYCTDCSHLYSRYGRALYQFCFNVYLHPDLVDLSILDDNEWKSRDNFNGVTRDHKVSVNEAIRNGYDPFYIKHPLNCELMLFTDNNEKNTNSSMEYSELVRIVNEYESRVQD